MKIKYIADDGKEFETQQECVAHEAAQWSALISGAAKVDIELASTYAPSHRALATALEHAGRLCAEARRKAGDLKRKVPERKKAE